MHGRPRRRDILIGVAAGTTAVGLGWWRVAGDDDVDVAYLSVVADAARRSEPALSRQVALEELGLSDAPGPGAGGWRDVLREREPEIRRDLGSGRTILAGGWVLARTEALVAVAST